MSSQMLVKQTCWPFNFHALKYAEFKIRQKKQLYQGTYQDEHQVVLLGIETHHLFAVPLARNLQRFQHVIPHGLQYDQAE
jgi:hypothetical protein